MGSNAHIPYRDSKLTRILQPSLGGNARTAIICTLSPATSHIEQSRNTLLFGSCAKEVVTNAQVNVVMSDKALVKHLQKELARLESELRHPVQSSSLETLLKEKDNQIRKVKLLVTFLTSLFSPPRLILEFAENYCFCVHLVYLTCCHFCLVHYEYFHTILLDKKSLLFLLHTSIKFHVMSIADGERNKRTEVTT